MQSRALLSLLAALVACEPAATPADASLTDAPPIDASRSDAGPSDWSFETIETRTVTMLERSRDVELVRAHRPDGGRSYFVYLPALVPDAPLVVLTQPYAGIDWTGEDVDARWATRGAGIFADDEAPDYDGDDLVAYEPQTVQAAADSGLVFIANNCAFIAAYGRFYAGGTIEDDSLDAVAPFYFARTRDDELDLDHMATWGGSWGGFMAYAGAARAPDDAAPEVAAVLWGPSDFSGMWAYTDAIVGVYPTPTQAEAFFSTYRRRIAGATGGPAPRAEFAPYDRDALCAGLGMSVLSLHDDWDTLVPVEQTRELVAACPRVEPLYWHRQTPIDYDVIGLDHGASADEEPMIPTAYTFSHAYILSRLHPTGPILLVTYEPALVSFLGLVRTEQMAGGDASDALPRLRELTDARIMALQPSGVAEPAADILARAVSTVYGRPYTAASLRAELATALPAP